MKLRKRKDGIWSVTYKTEHGNRTTTTGCPNYADALEVVKKSKIPELEKAAAVSRLSAQAVSQIISGEKVTVPDAASRWTKWLGDVGRSERTIDNYNTFIQAWIRDCKLEKMFPSEIQEEHIDTWVNDPRISSKAGSRQVMLSTVTSFMEYCVAKGFAFNNPASLVRVKFHKLKHEQKEPREKGIFSDEDVAKLMANAPEFWKAAIGISRWTGLRLGDICNLEWSCFNKPGKMVVWTDKRDRRVELEIPQQLADVLALVPIKDPHYLFPSAREILLDARRRSNLSVNFRRICQRLGIKGRTFHELRHTYVTDCVKRGIPMPHISRAVGHTSTSTTEGYNHA